MIEAAIPVYRCRFCNRIIPKKAIARAQGSGKMPTYCPKPRTCSNKAKQRDKRARAKERAQSAGGLSGESASEPLATE